MTSVLTHDSHSILNESRLHTTKTHSRWSGHQTPESVFLILDRKVIDHGEPVVASEHTSSGSGLYASSVELGRRKQAIQYKVVEATARSKLQSSSRLQYRADVKPYAILWFGDDISTDGPFLITSKIVSQLQSKHLFKGLPRNSIVHNILLLE